MLPQWLSEIAPIAADVAGCLGAVAALLGVVAAIRGFRQWRRELIGKERFRVAREIAILSLRFRDEFLRARSLLTFSEEWAQRQRRDDENSAEARVLDEYFARKKRLEPLQKNLMELQEKSWEANVILDKDISKLLEPLDQAFKELWGTIDAYFGLQVERARLNQPSINDDLSQSRKAIIYGTDPRPSKEVEEAVNSLLKELKSFVK